MKKILVIAALVSLISIIPAAGEGSPAMPFVLTGRNPVSLATGGALTTAGITPYASLEGIATSAFDSLKVAAGAGYQIYSPSFQKSTSINAGVSFKAASNLLVSASFISQNGEPYDILTPVGAKVGTFTPKEMMISAGVGYVIGESISLGAGFHYASQSLTEDFSTSAVCFDAQVAYKTGALFVSAGVNSLGGSVKSQSGRTYSLPSSAAVSGAYDLGLGESFAVKPCIKAEYYFTGGFGASLGAQFSYTDIAFVRAGYHLGTSAAPVPSFASLGLGVKLAGVSLDLAYLLASETLGGSLLAGLSYSF